VALVVIGGLAAGAAIGTGLRLAFGEARAVRAEEAGVAGALALRETRANLEEELGRALTATERRQLFDAFEAHLRALGFTRKNGGWERKRSTLERLLG